MLRFSGARQSAWSARLSISILLIHPVAAMGLTDVEGIAMQVLFVAGFGPIVRDRDASHRLYGDDLGILLDTEADGYLHTERLAGVKTFALWPLSQAAESCFGVPEWPDSVPVPQAWLEFDVDDLDAATAELRAKGYTLLVAARVEPWGQTVTRLLAPEGILVGITHTPSMRDSDTDRDTGADADGGGPPEEKT